MAALAGVQVIVVPDDNAQAVIQKIAPGILAQLGPNNTLMSNDSLRMYVRASLWDRMKDSFALTK